MSQKQVRPNAETRLEIRMQIIQKAAKGQSIMSIGRDLAKTYGSQGVTCISVMRDWHRRDRWLPVVLKLTKPDAALNSLLAQLETATREAWVVYGLAKQKKNLNAAVGAISQVAKISQATIELLQSLGKLTKAQDELMLTINTTPFDADPQMKQLLIDAATKQKLDKDAQQEATGESHS